MWQEQIERDKRRWLLDKQRDRYEEDDDEDDWFAWPRPEDKR
jgi:hypothetical protein